MALFGIGKSEIEVYCQKSDGRVFKLAVIGDVTLSRSANATSSLSLTVWRDEITPEIGETITFTLDRDHDMFWGYITDTNKHSRTVDITAKDQLMYLSQNTYTQNYGNLTASELYIRMSDDFGFNMVDPPTVEDTQYILPEVIMQNEHPIDTIIDALNTTFENTGERYYIYDAFNNLCLSSGFNDATLKVNTYMATHYNIKDYRYKEDINGLYDVIKVQTQEEDLSERKTVVAQNDAFIERFGRFEYYTQIKDGENPEAVAAQLLAEKCRVNISMSISGSIGEPRVFGGSSVYVDLYTNGDPTEREFIRGWFKVESVTHKFSVGVHTMDMELSLIRMDDEWEYHGINYHGTQSNEVKKHGGEV